MSIDRLRYFAAVVETRNLRKAAELVGISPPSMSKAISVLEEELGHKLIHPEGRGIGITQKGLDIYRLSTSLLEEHRRFYDRLNEPDKNSHQLRLATFEVFSTYFISSFLKTEPDLEILLIEKTPGAIEESILAGTADFGITYLPSPHHSLEYVEIGSFTMGIFGLKKWENQSFEDWPFATPITELRIHSSDVDSLDLWPKKGPRRKIKYRFELLETALQTSREGLSVLHCPQFIINLQNNQIASSLQLHSLKPPSQYKVPAALKIYLVGRKGAVPALLERKLAKFIRSIK